MISKIVGTTALVLVLLSSNCLALPQVTKAQAESLMRKSGLWEQLGSLEPQFRSRFNATVAKVESSVPPEKKARFNKAYTTAFATAYSPAHMRSVALGVFTTQLKASDVAAVDAWYNSPAGKSIAAAEEAAANSTNDQNAQIKTGSEIFYRSSLSRQTLLARLVGVTRAAEAVTNITINNILGIQKGVASVQPPSCLCSSTAEVRALLEKQRPKLLQANEQILIAVFAYSYESISDDDLRGYLTFMGSPSGRAFTEIGIRAIDRASVEAAQEFGRSLPRVSANLKPNL